ncbi:hypothetical protein DICVIV_14344 [Dictyocaulus viviparus]|uniref:Uncharacterized protein n=1 Tax=Dictyocaulus viviparus TaxID=29172 RepID=A0A0D8X5L6_DICVI|nr:hypothetical protein DICVIV_14344 [Dictyocaulus viviparus]
MMMGLSKWINERINSDYRRRMERPDMKSVGCSVKSCTDKKRTAVACVYRAENIRKARKVMDIHSVVNVIIDDLICKLLNAYEKTTLLVKTCSAAVLHKNARSYINHLSHLAVFFYKLRILFLFIQL